ncbi:MAG: molybdopterin-dependent oxidoreductase [Planctomycetota bacterium]|jgi:DMSO/TMAO reductase YedYZ molybdopterin-dependent catalytic subunit
MLKLTRTKDLKMNRDVPVIIVLLIILYAAGNVGALEAPPITPNDEFFWLAANGIPSIPEDWHFVVDGNVAQSLSLSLEDLAQYDPTTLMATLECYFPVGPDLLVGNANWTGVLLRTIIEQASPTVEAKSITFHALDGYSMGPYSLDDMLQRDDFILAYSMNGQSLPLVQGYPLKLVLPGIAGFQNARWLSRIEISSSEPFLSLYHYPIHARIFEPEYEGAIVLGTYTIRGMVYAGLGIDVNEIEISLNDGATWESAQLLNYYAPNVWKHWEFTWEIPQVGEYEIFARTKDSLGNVQNETEGFGWRGFSIPVTVDYDDDNDGIANLGDNCMDVYNPSQADSDGDGIGNSCDGDCPNFDGINPVNCIDFAVFANEWYQTGPALEADLNTDEIVDANDWSKFKNYWLSGCYEE